MNNNLFTKLFQIYTNAKGNNFNATIDYTIEHGGNAILIFPTDPELGRYCLRTSIPEVFKQNIIAQTLEESKKEQYRLGMSINTSLDDFIIAYEQIIKNPKLKQHVPEIYYPSTANNPMFIIMERINGEEKKLELLLPNCSNLLKDPLEKVYCLFRQEGFCFGDKVEAVWDGEKIIIVDLAEIRQIT